MMSSSGRRGRVHPGVLFVILAATLCATAGGCPDFRDGVVDAVEGATRTILLDAGDPQEAATSAGRGIFSAVLDLLFGRFRSDRTVN